MGRYNVGEKHAWYYIMCPEALEDCFLPSCSSSIQPVVVAVAVVSSCAKLHGETAVELLAIHMDDATKFSNHPIIEISQLRLDI